MKLISTLCGKLQMLRQVVHVVARCTNVLMERPSGYEIIFPFVLDLTYSSFLNKKSYINP